VDAPDARRGAMALRRGREKLVIAERDAPGELYDLEADPGETRDLAPLRPERTAALREELLGWVARMRREAEARGTLAVPSEAPHPVDALRALGYVE
jgi:arylsulfatase A-like enzyme